MSLRVGGARFAHVYVQQRHVVPIAREVGLVGDDQAVAVEHGARGLG